MTNVLLEEPADAGVKPSVVEVEKVADPKRVLLLLALGVDGWAMANAISRPPGTGQWPLNTSNAVLEALNM